MDQLTRGRAEAPTAWLSSARSSSLLRSDGLPSLPQCPRSGSSPGRCRISATRASKAAAISEGPRGRGRTRGRSRERGRGTGGRRERGRGGRGGPRERGRGRGGGAEGEGGAEGDPEREGGAWRGAEGEGGAEGGVQRGRGRGRAQRERAGHGGVQRERAWQRGTQRARAGQRGAQSGAQRERAGAEEEGAGTPCCSRSRAHPAETAIRARGEVRPTPIPSGPRDLRCCFPRAQRAASRCHSSTGHAALCPARLCTPRTTGRTHAVPGETRSNRANLTF